MRERKGERGERIVGEAVVIATFMRGDEGEREEEERKGKRKESHERTKKIRKY